jgi:VIT1/CCC1 family predicted Fe2+/Mn2+ transporter
MSAEATAGRPGAGLGHYLRDVVYGATDGAITTIAVVAGASGASFPAAVGLVLGVANLVADGLSMAASNYLGMKSELEQIGASVAAEQPWRHALATWAAFVIAGAVPLLAYAIATTPAVRLAVALALTVVTLGIVGAGRASFIGRPRWRCALEVIAIGGGAAGAAYAIGAGLGAVVRS